MRSVPALVGLAVAATLAAPAPARACGDGFWVWPEHGRLPPNGRILLEGRGDRAKLVAAIVQHDPTLVSRDHRVRLRANGVYTGRARAKSDAAAENDISLQVAQAWLEPLIPLVPGHSYFLELEGVRAEAMRADAGGVSLPIVFFVEAAIDRAPPAFLEPPELIDSGLLSGDVIATSVHDEGPVLIRVEAERTRTSTTPERYHYAVEPGDIISIGAPGSCRGGLIFDPGEPAILRLSAIDVAGRAVSAPGRGLLRGPGAIGSRSLLDAYAAAPRNSPLTLRVKILDELDQPVSGARVLGYWPGTPIAFTGASGEVVFRDLRETVATVHVSHPQLGEMEVSERLPEVVRHTMIARFGAGPVLEVRVRDEAMEPIAEAAVTIIGPAPDYDTRRLTTDVTGEAIFRRLTTAEYLILVDGRPAYGIVERVAAVEEAFQSELVQLAKALVIRGRLLLPPGVEATGWRVTATPAGSALHPSHAMTSTSVRASDDGRFVLGGLAAGEHLVSAYREEPSDLLFDGGRTRLRVQVQPGMSELELRVGGAAIIEGTVEYEGGQAPPDLRVSLRGDGQLRPKVRTDAARGTFATVVPDLGPHRLIVRAPGFRPSVTTIEVTGDRPLHPRIFLMRAEGVGGVVRDPSGAPLAGVLITPRAFDLPVELEEAVTDLWGRFFFSELDPGDRLMLKAEARGRATLASKDLELVMPRGAPVVGRVLLQDHQKRRARMIWRELASTSPPIADVELFGALGFRLPDVPLGVFQVEVEPEGANENWVQIVRRTELEQLVMLGARRARVKLVLEIPAEVAQTGDIRVSLFGAGAGGAIYVHRAAVPKQGGQVLLQNIPPGYYRAVAEWLGPSGPELLLEKKVRVSACCVADRVVLQP